MSFAENQVDDYNLQFVQLWSAQNFLINLAINCQINPLKCLLDTYLITCMC